MGTPEEGSLELPVAIVLCMILSMAYVYIKTYFMGNRDRVFFFVFYFVIA